MRGAWNALTGKDEPPRRKTTSRIGGKSSGGSKINKVVRKPVGKKSNGVKKGNKKTSQNVKGRKKQQSVKGKILTFLKEHWVLVTMVLIGVVAIVWFGAIGGSALAASSQVLKASKNLNSATSGNSVVTATLKHFGWKALPKGAKVLAPGVVKFANGGMIASGDGDIDIDINF